MRKKSSLPVSRRQTRHLKKNKPGTQTLITKRITDFANRFPGRNLETIKKIVKTISNFKIIKADAKTIKEKYTKRTASQILRTKNVFVKRPVRGCVDYNVVLCSVLRAKNIKAFFARNKRNHSVTIFELNKKWYRADPMPERVKEDFHIVEIDLEEEKNDLIAFGKDAWSIGLTDITKFDLGKEK